MKDNLKKNTKNMEDYLKKKKNGRRPQKNGKRTNQPIGCDTIVNSPSLYCCLQTNIFVDTFGQNISKSMSICQNLWKKYHEINENNFLIATYFKLKP